MTYGEARQIQQDSMRLVNGIWIGDPLPECNRRMSKEQALYYYSRKLARVWTELKLKENNVIR